MRALGIIFFVLVIIALGIGSYILWQNLPFGHPIVFSQYHSNDNYSFSQATYNGSQDLPTISPQFYPNMRYEDKLISYYISGSCDSTSRSEAEQAFQRISSLTVLSFYPTNAKDAEIAVLCSNVAPTAEEEGHFVAGEGGPSYIINASAYSVIITGKISLYRTDSCDQPQIATHEILHALGFNHNSNSDSIMFPVTNCNQKVDSSIINEINRLYGVPSLPDLTIIDIEANKTGKYLNFVATVENMGLRDSENSNLSLYYNDERINSFSLNTIPVGNKKVLTVSNLATPYSASNFRFIVETSESEINSNNNEADITLQ